MEIADAFTFSRLHVTMSKPGITGASVEKSGNENPQLTTFEIAHKATLDRNHKNAQAQLDFSQQNDTLEDGNATYIEQNKSLN
ncbi:hypothetical protein [Martelella soudanensis]|uniref:hypothetical protein n=1 Tax=unclassified Martelella TaxID=2629616 RepID=UPI0015DE78D9|nr:MULTISPECIES: hypothetical protein [unclassified Martelella]